jgi:hypothetical protein
MFSTWWAAVRFGDHERLRDFSVGHAATDQACNLHLASAERKLSD